MSEEIVMRPHNDIVKHDTTTKFRVFFYDGSSEVVRENSRVEAKHKAEGWRKASNRESRSGYVAKEI